MEEKFEPFAEHEYESQWIDGRTKLRLHGRPNKRKKIEADKIPRIYEAIRKGWDIDINHALIDGDIDISGLSHGRSFTVFGLVRISNSNIKGLVNFAMARFEDQVDFCDTRFRKAYFAGARFGDAFFRRATFEYADFTEASFCIALFIGVHFRAARFTKTNFEEAYFQKASFDVAQFWKASFAEATFEETHFGSHVSFREAYFDKPVSFGKVKILENTVARGLWNEVIHPLFILCRYLCPVCRALDKLWARMRKVLLFSVEAKAHSNLKRDAILEGLRRSFKENGISLSDKANLSAKQADPKWLISDENTVYIIEKEEEKLNIYREIEHIPTDFSRRGNFLCALWDRAWKKKAPVTNIYEFNTNTVMDSSTNPRLKRYIDDEQWIESWRTNPKGRWWREPVFRLWELTSHCGRSIGLWVLWSVIIAMLFACIYTSLGIENVAFDATELLDEQPTFSSYLYYSVVTFTTLGFGDIVPLTGEARLAVGCEVVLGYIMLGGLISIFANKFARRS